MDLKWFLTASTAAHVALLLAWAAPAPEAGNPGKVLRLDLVHKTAQPAAAIVSSQESARPPARDMSARLLKHIIATAPEGAAPGIVHSVAAQPASMDTPASARLDETASEQYPPIAASSPRPSRKESERQLRESVMKLVTGRFSYPPVARRKGWQGVVTIELRIESSGVISDLQVNQTSGYTALDRAALKSLQTASIPDAAQWLHGRSIAMLIPIEYRLLDS